jgi:peroxiredoxin
MPCSSRSALPGFALVFALCLTGLAACGPATHGSGGGAPGIGAQATDFTLRDYEGRQFSLAEHFGKRVVLLDFWATWCVPCEAEMPHLERLYERYRDQGFIVYAIAMDGPETVASVGSLARRLGVTFPVLLDEETRVTAVYNPHRTAPLSVLIDRSGRIRTVHQGYVAGDEVALEREIQGLLAAGAASAPAAPRP